MIKDTLRLNSSLALASNVTFTKGSFGLDWKDSPGSTDFKPSTPELYQPVIQENNFPGSIHPTQVVIPIKESILAVYVV